MLMKEIIGGYARINFMIFNFNFMRREKEKKSDANCFLFFSFFLLLRNSMEISKQIAYFGFIFGAPKLCKTVQIIFLSYQKLFIIKSLT